MKRLLNREWLPAGHPYEHLWDNISEKQVNLTEAIWEAYSIKLKTGRKASHDSYRSNCNLLIRWLKKNGYDQLPLNALTRKMARHYMNNRYIEDKINNNTYNNLLRRLTTPWNELIKEGYIENNPWKMLRRKRKQEKNKSALTSQERKVITTYMY